jgi:hypothetical protein
LRPGAAGQQQDTGANHKIDVHCCPQARREISQRHCRQIPFCMKAYATGFENLKPTEEVARNATRLKWSI